MKPAKMEKTWPFTHLQMFSGNTRTKNQGGWNWLIHVYLDKSHYKMGSDWGEVMNLFIYLKQNNTHPFNSSFSRTTRVSRYQKGKPIWILLKQVSGSGVSWAICKSAPRSRQTTTPAPTTQFLQAGCPTNGVKARRQNKTKQRRFINHLVAMRL